MKLTRRLQLYSLAIVALTIVAILTFNRTIAWRDVLIPAVIAIVLAFFLAMSAARLINRHLEDLISVTRSLGAGNLLSRPTLGAPGELGELATAVYRLAEQLGMRMSALQSEDALLAALIESLNEGVLAIGPQRTVLRINQAGRDILRINDRAPFALDRLPRAPSLSEAVYAALDGKVTQPVELTLGDRVVSLTARPLAGGGAVLALFDLTQVRQLEIVRRDFVANVSHELRTPLTVIRGFAETLADEDPPETSRRHFASTIRSHTQRMQRIVDDLLDISRLETGRWTADISVVPVETAAQDVFAAAGKAAEEKGIALETAIAHDADSVIADRTAVRQILGNLVENALRYTDRGSISIFTQRKPKGILIGVRDTGAGIPPEHVSRIFERFYRVDGGRSRTEGGTGLGLAIVKHLAEAHGGHVLASSEVRLGTTITVFFPQRPE
ncbi:MAG TPA: ATP-binding protein [Gemmatimonadaceae bacterium]|nr:ATP-binding protein [Gemmatimonadaceae bacterium]